MAKYDEEYWRKLIKKYAPITLMGSLKRMVENQEQKVTVPLVDDLHEHQLLEQMLEESKPNVPAELSHLDYLLRSPWRYPPLPWGSRFGRRHEPGLFYGSLSNEALFSEAAYYRFVFIDGLETPFADRVISQHTVFEAMYRTEMGVDLNHEPFSRCTKVLTDPANYWPCQSLGSALRETRFEALVFQSARSTTKELNIALLQPAALRSRKHLRPKRGLCDTHPERVTFEFEQTIRSFERSQFVQQGQLPMPA